MKPRRSPLAPQLALALHEDPEPAARAKVLGRFYRPRPLPAPAAGTLLLFPRPA